MTLDVNDLAIQYNNGATTTVLGRQYGVSRQYIHSMLAGAGIQLRNPGWPRKEAAAASGSVGRFKYASMVDDWAKQYNSGATLEEIAGKNGCTPMTVRQYLIRAGVEIRKRGPKVGNRD